MNRFFSRVLVLFLASGGFFAAGRLAAQDDASDSFCILPIYDALTSGVPDATLQAEMDKLKAQIGPQRNYFKVGFSNIFGGPTSGASAARMAAANGLSCGFIIALQTHDVSSTTAAVAAKDLRLYQWRLDGKTWQGVNTGTATNPAYPARDYLVVTPSRYATALQNSFKSQIQTTAGQIKTVMTDYPGTVVVVNGIIEEELATGDGTDTYLADYSPFAVTEFRDWLRHTGMYDDSTGTYAGQGAPAAITGAFVTNSKGVLSSPFYDDPTPATLGNGRTGPTFNATFGTSFTTWTLLSWDLTAYPNAITNTSFAPMPAMGATGNTPGGFDAPRVRNTSNAYWNAWSYDILDHNSVYPSGNPTAPAFGFRQVMIKHFVNDLLGWVVAAGIPKQIVYAHQIPGETAGATRARTGADPMWTGETDFNGHLGVTRFGSFPYDTALTYSQNWGIFEWHPDPGAVATDPVLYSSTISSLDSYYANGAHVLFPGWWENTNGTTFLLTDSNFAVGLHDWLAAQPDLPPPGGQGLEAQYFNNITLSGAPALARVDPAINFTWTGVSPGTGVNPTNFSVQWTGWVQARYTETYTFYTDTDDGARLYVNNTTLVDHFVTQSATEYSGTINLVAGQYYPIVMQYFQGTGTASATLSWSSASQTKQVISQNQLYPALPTTNWTNTTTGSTLAWPTAGNWSGSIAPTSGSDAAVQFLGGQTAAAGTLTANNSASSFALNALQLSGTASSSGASTVALTGGTLAFGDASSGAFPFITLDALKSSAYAMTYTVANPLTLGDYTTILGNGTAGFTFSGAISGAGGLLKQGSAGLTLSGSNNFAAAPVTVEGGILTMGNLSALSGAGAVYVETGGQLNATVNGTFPTFPLTLNGNAAGASNSGGALRFNVNTATIIWPGAINLESNSQITFYSAGGSYTFSSPITGVGDLQFRGGGAAVNHYHTAVLAAASTYTGNTTAFGDAGDITLQLSGGADRLPTSTILTLAGDYFNSTALRGWLDLNGNNQTLAGLTTTNGARGLGDNRVLNSATTTNATLTINDASAGTFTGVLGSGAGDSRNNFNLLVTGAGTFTLSGINTYTGYTSVTGGTLALASASNNIAASPIIDVETGATLDVSSVTGGCVLGSGQTLTGVGGIKGAITISGHHQPGLGGTETFASGVTFAATAHEVWQLLGNVTSGATTSFDQVAVTGTATVKSGAVIDVNLAATGSSVNMTNAFWTQAHTWPLLTATTISGTFAVGTTGSDSAGNTVSYYGAFSVTQSATVATLAWTPFKAFAVWQNTHFGANAGNATVAGPRANPSGDGIPNLLKYALGLNPSVASVSGLPAMVLNGGRLQMQFARNTGATDLILQVLASNDLMTWDCRGDIGSRRDELDHGAGGLGDGHQWPGHRPRRHRGLAYGSALPAAAGDASAVKRPSL